MIGTDTTFTCHHLQQFSLDHLSMSAPVECNYACPPATSSGIHLEWHEFFGCILLSAFIGGCITVGAPSIMKWVDFLWIHRFDIMVDILKLFDYNRTDRLDSFSDDYENDSPLLRYSYSSMEVCNRPQSMNEQDSPPPPRFVRACCGNVRKARSRWEKTLAWRKSNNIDQILNEAHPNFEAIQQLFPAYTYGKGRKGHVVVYEKLGGVNAKALRDQGISMSMLLRHYILRMEYLWNIVEPSDDAQLITIQDLAGVGIKDLTGVAMDFIKNAANLAGNHYVERSYKNYIINAPHWFGMIWTMISPFIDVKTRKKVRILGANYRSVLQEEISASMIPFCYGGTCRVPLTSSPHEKDFSAMILGNNKEAERKGLNVTNCQSLKCTKKSKYKSTQRYNVNKLHIDVHNEDFKSRDVRLSTNETDLSDSSSQSSATTIDYSLKSRKSGALHGLLMCYKKVLMRTQSKFNKSQQLSRANTLNAL